MSEITQFFQERCGKALVKAAADRDMDLIIYASYGSYSCPYGRNLLSEIGKKNIIHLPDYSSFDGIIVLPNTFDIHGMDTEFFEVVRKHAHCPVICLQNDFSDQYPEFYSITVENLETMYSMTKHFIDVHGFTDICYMSGPFVSKDSPDRLRGFKRAMEEAGLEVRPNMVYEGNYWLNRGGQAMEFFMEGRDTYPQAVICANDYMALSICDELKKRGLRVPEDVCVSGFDGIREGQQNDPPLTTVTISPELYAETAVLILDDLFAGKIHINPLNFRTMDHDMDGALVSKREDILVHFALLLLNHIRFAGLLNHVEQLILGQVIIVRFNAQDLVYQDGRIGESLHGGFENHADKVHDWRHRNGNALRVRKPNGFRNKFAQHDGDESDDDETYNKRRCGS